MHFPTRRFGEKIGGEAVALYICGHASLPADLGARLILPMGLLSEIGLLPLHMLGRSPHSIRRGYCRSLGKVRLSSLARNLGHLLDTSLMIPANPLENLQYEVVGMPVGAIVENLQRVGFLVVVPQLLREFGIDPASVLAALGLEPSDLDDPEGVISYPTMGRLIESCVVRSGCQHFGLLIGQRAGTLSLGLIGDLMRHAPTLGVALRDLVRHQHRHSHGSVVYLLEHGDNVLFGYAILQPGIAGAAQIYDGSMAIAFSIIRRAVGNADSDELTVFMSRSKPSDLEPYRRCFGATMQFDNEHTGVLVPRSWMDRPTVGANPVVRTTLEKGATSYWKAGDYDVITQIRRTLAEGLLTGEIGSDAVARLLGFSQRSLRRRLDEHQTSFQEILNETRFEWAKQLLYNTDLGIGQIGLVLRYSDPSVFTRAFTRWSGLRPSEWRMHVRTSNWVEGRL